MCSHTKSSSTTNNYHNNEPFIGQTDIEAIPMTALRRFHHEMQELARDDTRHKLQSDRSARQKQRRLLGTGNDPVVWETTLKKSEKHAGRSALETGNVSKNTNVSLSDLHALNKVKKFRIPEGEEYNKVVVLNVKDAVRKQGLESMHRAFHGSFRMSSPSSRSNNNNNNNDDDDNSGGSDRRRGTGIFQEGVVPSSSSSKQQQQQQKVKVDPEEEKLRLLYNRFFSGTITGGAQEEKTKSGSGSGSPSSSNNISRNQSMSEQQMTTMDASSHRTLLTGSSGGSANKRIGSYRNNNNNNSSIRRKHTSTSNKSNNNLGSSVNLSSRGSSMRSNKNKNVNTRTTATATSAGEFTESMSPTTGALTLPIIPLPSSSSTTQEQNQQHNLQGESSTSFSLEKDQQQQQQEQKEGEQQQQKEEESKQDVFGTFVSEIQATDNIEHNINTNTSNVVYGSFSSKTPHPPSSHTNQTTAAGGGSNQQPAVTINTTEVLVSSFTPQLVRQAEADFMMMSYGRPFIHRDAFLERGRAFTFDFGGGRQIPFAEFLDVLNRSRTDYMPFITFVNIVHPLWPVKELPGMIRHYAHRVSYALGLNHEQTEQVETLWHCAEPLRSVPSSENNNNNNNTNTISNNDIEYLDYDRFVSIFQKYKNKTKATLSSMEIDLPLLFRTADRDGDEKVTKDEFAILIVHGPKSKFFQQSSSSSSSFGSSSRNPKSNRLSTVGGSFMSSESGGGAKDNKRLQMLQQQQQQQQRNSSSASGNNNNNINKVSNIERSASNLSATGVTEHNNNNNANDVDVPILGQSTSSGVFPAISNNNNNNNNTPHNKQQQQHPHTHVTPRYTPQNKARKPSNWAFL